MVENNIKSKTKLLNLADEQKKAGEKDLEHLFYFAQQKDWVTYLKIPRKWSLKAKFFAQNKPTWKWLMSIHIRAVQTPVMQSDWTGL